MPAALNEHSKQSLRLWLQLLNLTTLIEKRIRRKLQSEFDITLPRFDVLANLDRAGRKITMGELSQNLLVSKGNVTGVVVHLEKEGLLKRERDKSDRRTHYLSLTPKGRQEFRKLAQAHENWIDGVFSNLEEKNIGRLLHDLGVVRKSLVLKSREGKAS